MNYYLDTDEKNSPKMITGEAYRAGLEKFATEPFRLVPYFAPEVWGGQWMKEACGLDKAAKNYAWAFDGVPEENSLFLRVGKVRAEIPAVDAVFYNPRKLLGDRVHARFGDEFPIRFDFLDTMGGQNLSLQVHPLTEYIQNTFGMHYTQDESYYILDCKEDTCVYLGLKEGIDKAAMLSGLEAAQNGKSKFDAEKYVNKLPCKKHDHFLIPAGTVHCSGADTMVLEISATPYIFTFKLFDWDRLGLDGLPRPVHLSHGRENIQWDRTTGWVKKNLVNRFEPLSEADGVKAERTGLHEREFIETVRHTFKEKAFHGTNGSVTMLNLVSGAEAVVESPDGAFEPFIVHYAETFIIPESVKRYTVRPSGESEGKEIMTVKAFVRG
jgi:mannose-6-phosphate isomerase class I